MIVEEVTEYNNEKEEAKCRDSVTEEKKFSTKVGDVAEIEISDVQRESIIGAVDLDLNMLGSQGFNVLHAACGSGNIEMTKYLLKQK